MGKVQSLKKWFHRFPFSSLPMQQRFPLLICVLLLSVITVISWISYIGVKKAALQIGRERLTALTEQLGSMFGQSAQGITKATLAIAGNEAVKKYLQAGEERTDSAALAALKKLQPDSTWVLVELLNAKRATVLQSYRTRKTIHVNRDSAVSLLSTGTDSCRIGKLYLSNDSMYYPVVAAVSHEKQITGYLLRWRVQSATPRAISQFSQLLGKDARFYIGNADGSLWSDLAKPVPAPPADSQLTSGFLEYSKPGNGTVIATARHVPGTQWLIMVEFPLKIVLEAASRFLRWIIILGTILIAAGFVVAWALSRNITRPINRLTAAASAIAGGDYSQKVEVDRTDEIGKLSRAFNAMMTQVSHSRQNLEKKVQDRTDQLERANKELEAFSYSVSHDLRAPLRIIDGYAGIIIEDYTGRVDDEGKRMLGIITESARKMGALIDDLLNLSRLGRKELTVHYVDMNKIVEPVITELVYPVKKPPVIQTGKLEPAYCDSSLIRQVWMNLISNAVKYSSGKENPVIEISSEKTGNEIVYSIKDNGVGFDMKYANKLFGVFQRLHNDTEYEGTGVGLALVYRIVTRHAGRVWADAKVNEGATFFFSLPLNHSPGQADLSAYTTFT